MFYFVFPFSYYVYYNNNHTYIQIILKKSVEAAFLYKLPSYLLAQWKNLSKKNFKSKCYGQNAKIMTNKLLIKYIATSLQSEISSVFQLEEDRSIEHW